MDIEGATIDHSARQTKALEELLKLAKMWSTIGLVLIGLAVLGVLIFWLLAAAGA